MDVARVLRHVRSTQRDARKLFDRDALQRLQQVIADGEVRHRGEVRLIVESALPLRKVIRGMTTRHRAIDLFGSYRVWDTEDNNGVLLYLNVADRRIEIVADRAATRGVEEGTWRAIAARAQLAFKARDYESGAAKALVGIHDALTQAFPADANAPRGELADTPVMR